YSNWKLRLKPVKDSIGVSFIAINLTDVYNNKLTTYFVFTVNDIVNVKEELQTTKNLIFPNPASDFLNINSENIIGKDISIYDILGNKLMSATATGAETRINIESYPSGVYFVRIGEITRMFVK
ncbi:MAG: T9SS type A sorting domain-containing protein, partial [FCB group bacterium]